VALIDFSQASCRSNVIGWVDGPGAKEPKKKQQLFRGRRQKIFIFFKGIFLLTGGSTTTKQ